MIKFIDNQNRRQFIDSLLNLGAVFTLGRKVTAFSPLEAEVSSAIEQQPARQLIATFSDGSKQFGIIERYSDGAFLNQNVRLNDDYDGEILYFIRNGAAKENSEWSFRFNLYKKGSQTPVNTMRVDGSAETGKFEVMNISGQNKPNLVESTLTEGAYEQSSMFGLTKRTPADLRTYLNYFTYMLNLATKDIALKPMPPGYNPLK